MAKKPLEIDCIAGSQLRDTQGEMLSVEGADISELEAGKGRWNDNHGKGFFNSVGRITSAKKIMKEEDCDNDRHRYYWNKVKVPFIYASGYLYDDEDHPNAKAAAAILRNIHKADSPLQLKASVEGGVLARGVKDPSLLARTKIHSVALTFTPANNNTLVEPTSLDKSFIDEEADLLLIKSVMHLAETNVPSFRHIARDASATKVQQNLYKLIDLMKDLGIEGQLHVPSKQQIIEKALEQKIHNNVQEIAGRIRGLRADTLDKGLKEAVTAGAIAALAPSVASNVGVQQNQEAIVAPQKAVKPSKLQHEHMYRELVNKYPILGAICNIESSGGKNLDHQTIDNPNSIHFGHTAGGLCGMMPHSAALIVNNSPELAGKYPKLAEAAKDVNKNHRVFTDTFNADPQAAADFAIAMINRNKSKTKSPHQLVYSWKNGLKGSWDKLNNEGLSSIKEHPYVQAVMSEYEKIKPQKDQLKKPLNKALMAGYGGAGAPTSLSSGGVFQSESLESGRPSFKHVTCDHCGKEQVYAKFQVKCRECGHSMSLEKIYRVMKDK